jgi:DNA-binding protein HU-beta
MNKGDLIARICEECNLSKKQGTDAVNAVFSAISDSLKSGDKATLVGFGTFSVSEREARTGRNPQTGESINIAARKVIKFKAGRELSDNVNG